jgi:branched-chain amino acid transport system permease protein
VGAYTAAILSTRYHFSFWLLLPLSGLMAAAVSMLLGVPTLRLKGVFFTITTLGFSEIIRMTVLNWESLTRGTMGIPGIPYPVLFGMKLKSNAEFYWIILGIAVVAYISIYLLINSRIGRAWIAIREDEAAARSMGVETYKYKLMNLAISAFWAGVVGCFYAFFSAYVSADSFKLDESFSMVAMLLVGGQGTMLGPAVGAIVLTVLPEVFRSLVEYRLVIFGAAIVIMILLRPQGIVGGFRLANFQLPAVKPAKPGKGA